MFGRDCLVLANWVYDLRAFSFWDSKNISWYDYRNAGTVGPCSRLVICPFSVLERAPRPSLSRPAPARFGLEVVFTEPRVTKRGSLSIPDTRGVSKDSQQNSLGAIFLVVKKDARQY
eukprot:6103098-Pyramimonas_sp.AAC.1